MFEMSAADARGLMKDMIKLNRRLTDLDDEAYALKSKMRRLITTLDFEDSARNRMLRTGARREFKLYRRLMKTLMYKTGTKTISNGVAAMQRDGVSWLEILRECFSLSADVAIPDATSTNLKACIHLVDPRLFEETNVPVCNSHTGTYYISGYLRRLIDDDEEEQEAVAAPKTV